MQEKQTSLVSQPHGHREQRFVWCNEIKEVRQRIPLMSDAEENDNVLAVVEVSRQTAAQVQ